MNSKNNTNTRQLRKTFYTTKSNNNIKIMNKLADFEKNKKINSSLIEENKIELKKNFNTIDTLESDNLNLNDSNDENFHDKNNPYKLLKKINVNNNSNKSGIDNDNKQVTKVNLNIAKKHDNYEEINVTNNTNNINILNLNSSNEAQSQNKTQIKNDNENQIQAKQSTTLNTNLHPINNQLNKGKLIYNSAKKEKSKEITESLILTIESEKKLDTNLKIDSKCKNDKNGKNYKNESVKNIFKIRENSKNSINSINSNSKGKFDSFSNSISKSKNVSKIDSKMNKVKIKNYDDLKLISYSNKNKAFVNMDKKNDSQAVAQNNNPNYLNLSQNKLEQNKISNLLVNHSSKTKNCNSTMNKNDNISLKKSKNVKNNISDNDVFIKVKKNLKSSLNKDNIKEKEIPLSNLYNTECNFNNNLLNSTKNIHTSNKNAFKKIRSTKDSKSLSQFNTYKNLNLNQSVVPVNNTIKQKNKSEIKSNFSSDKKNKSNKVNLDTSMKNIKDVTNKKELNLYNVNNKLKSNILSSISSIPELKNGNNPLNLNFNFNVNVNVSDHSFETYNNNNEGNISKKDFKENLKANVMSIGKNKNSNFNGDEILEILNYSKKEGNFPNSILNPVLKNIPIALNSYRSKNNEKIDKNLQALILNDDKKKNLISSKLENNSNSNKTNICENSVGSKLSGKLNEIEPVSKFNDKDIDSYYNNHFDLNTNIHNFDNISLSSNKTLKSAISIKESKLNENENFTNINNSIVELENIFQVKKIKRIHQVTKIGTLVGKTKNQDSHFIFENFEDNPENLFIGICDGHGQIGHEISDFISQTLPDHLNKSVLLRKKEILDKKKNKNRKYSNNSIDINNKVENNKIAIGKKTSVSNINSAKKTFIKEKFVSKLDDNNKLNNIPNNFTKSKNMSIKPNLNDKKTKKSVKEDNILNHNNEFLNLDLNYITGQDYHNIIKEVFLDVNNMVLDKFNMSCNLSGSTCCSLIYMPTKVICANVGDSRCVIGKLNNGSKSLKYYHSMVWNEFIKRS